MMFIHHHPVAVDHVLYSYEIEDIYIERKKCINELVKYLLTNSYEIINALDYDSEYISSYRSVILLYPKFIYNLRNNSIVESKNTIIEGIQNFKKSPLFHIKEHIVEFYTDLLDSTLYVTDEFKKYEHEFKQLIFEIKLVI